MGRKENGSYAVFEDLAGALAQVEHHVQGLSQRPNEAVFVLREALAARDAMAAVRRSAARMLAYPHLRKDTRR
jgi:hypothetical protein